MFNVDGRRVKVVTGGKTQTVNICTAENRHGAYDYTLRLRPPFITEEQLRRAAFSSVIELIQYLQQNHNASIERSPSDVSVPSSAPVIISKPLPAPLSNGETTWHHRAKKIVEESIDQFVLDFVAFPYLHRVEHSIHCELYRILKSHTLFASTYPMGSHISQPVHKEWPEYKRRPDKDGRGNFDLCIIPPEELKSAAYDDFKKGKLRPFAAIELGLNYKLDHLQQDADKFENSGIPNSYLVHLVQDELADNFVGVENFIVNSQFKIGYARIAGKRAFYKLVNDTDIQETDR